MVIEQFAEDAPLSLRELPTPEPQDNEVLIRIDYASINPVDQKIRAGLLTSRLPHAFPLILGWDAAGTIAKVGKNVGNFKVNDAVFAYCRKPTMQWGTFAEYVTVDETCVAHAPSSISLKEAAAVPLVGLTAWQSLASANLQKGQTILIHAGAGGVGSLAIQFAKIIGAFVITTCSQKNESYVKNLGADLIIDYTKDDFVVVIQKAFPEGIDAVFDTMGGETAQRSLKLLRPKGHFVSILEHFESTKAFSASYVFVQPNGRELTQIATLIDQGKVQPPAIEVMPLKDAEAGLQKIQTGHVRGKIVLDCHAL